MNLMSYERRREQIEHYFDRTAADTWAKLTSDEPVSGIRQTVREGRDQMRATILSWLPQDLHGKRLLDAGCGTGALAFELAERGADVVGVDISPQLIEIARTRTPANVAGRLSFVAGDMTAARHGTFDYVVAMDSLIYYSADDIKTALTGLAKRTSGSVLFTVAPRTRMLMAMWYAGKLFPRSDRSPVMVPHAPAALAALLQGEGRLRDLGRIKSGFYISQALGFVA